MELKDKVSNFIKRGEEISRTEFHPANGFTVSYVSGPKFDAWMGEINIFNERYLKKHPLHNSIQDTYFLSKNRTSSCEDMLGHLRALFTDDEFFGEIPAMGESLQAPNYDAVKSQKEGSRIAMSNKIFIVHGHDTVAKLEMARTLEKAGFEAIILHEQASAGKTIIEKIEANTDVAFAVVLYTPCDIGRAKEEKVENERNRARQNVVFEHGYLIGKLGRNRVSALVKGNIETPGDISGVVYIDMDDAGAWKMKLAKEMINAGLKVDMNKFL